MAEKDWMATVRALLARAQHQNTPREEADACTAKAAAIMAKHGIDEALLAETDPNVDKVIDKVIELPQPFSKEKAILLHHMATAMRCSAVKLTKKAPHQVHVFGYSTDVERLEVLFTSVLFQAVRFLAQEYIPPQDKRGSYERAWLMGYTAEIRQRLTQIECNAQKDAPLVSASGKSTDLVLIDRTAIVNGTMSKVYPSVRQAKVTFRGSGYGDGSQAGQRADLGQRRRGRQRVEIGR
ncbi:MAG TPA: DUF2786 domain-containing protein [Candidatus Paceibacterota bacterium]